MEHPNKLIDTFTGVLELEGIGKQSMLSQNVLLRGCVLRNTDWIIGCVVNSGHDTKIMMSATGTPSKTSFLEQAASSEIQKIIYLLAFVCLVGSTGATIWNSDKHVKEMWYLDWNPNPGAYFFIQYFYFFLLHATFIPVSLYVSMTLVRFFQSYFMNNDLEMYYSATDTPSAVRTMTLNEELGQISHVFTDKTGTLTCNIMDFRKASINGVSYGLGITEIGKASWKLQGKVIPPEFLQAEEKAKLASVPHVSFYDPRYVADRAKNDQQSSKIRQFFHLLALCHDTIPESIEGKIKLSASNPDDEALVCAASYFGFEFRDRRGKIALVWNEDAKRVEEIPIVESIVFSSKRKRMSVITQGLDGRKQLLCKGADSTILPRLCGNQDDLVSQTVEHMRQYSQEGLRCLLIAHRDISEGEFQSWSARYQEASTNMEELEKRKANLPNRIEDLEDEIEQQLVLIGCTAIEDKLQDGVPDAIAQIARAGVNIWVLTGDKEETAINIAVACNLVLPEEYMRHVIVNQRICPTLQSAIALLDSETVCPTLAAFPLTIPQVLCQKVDDELVSALPRALIIDGPSLIGIMSSPEAKQALLDFSQHCRAVVGCRSVSALLSVSSHTRLLLPTESLRIKSARWFI
jgi:phospholipid-transporting ATPase